MIGQVWGSSPHEPTIFGVLPSRTQSSTPHRMPFSRAFFQLGISPYHPGPGCGCKIRALWPNPPRNKDCVHRNPTSSKCKTRPRFRKIWIPSKRLRKNLFRPATRRHGSPKRPSRSKRNPQIRRAKNRREFTPERTHDIQESRAYGKAAHGQVSVPR